MKNTKKLSIFKFISHLIIFSLLVTFAISVMTGCSSAGETVKASKKK